MIARANSLALSKTVATSTRGNGDLAAKVGCVELDKVNLSPGFRFEPDAKGRIGFPFSSFLFAELVDDGKNEPYVAVMLTTHRVILRGQRLDRLVEWFHKQQVVMVKALPRSEKLLATQGEGEDPVVTAIEVSHLKDEAE